MKNLRTIKMLLCVAVVGVMLNLTAKASLTTNTVNLATYGVGYCNPTFLGSAFTVTQLNNMITTYNSGSSSSPYFIYQGTQTPAPNLGTVSALGTTQGGSGNPTGNYIDLGTGGYTYLTCQWDGPNGGNCIYYIAGLTGWIDLVNDLPGYYNTDHPKSQLGLSGYELTYSTSTPVPEPSTIVAGALLLLPLGVSAIRIVRKSRTA